MSDKEYILTLSCRDCPGVVALVATSLFEGGADILESHHYADPETGAFFGRIRFKLQSDGQLVCISTNLQLLAPQLQLDWKLLDGSVPLRVLIMLSRFDHCAADLLYKWRAGELMVDIVGIVSNYPRESYTNLDFHGISFWHLPVTRETKRVQEDEISKIIEDTEADLIVLARYMQILSSEFASKIAGRCINIHHSFLPSFKGARPYQQAHSRGVKLIGATAHFVTADLDEGPIIEQDVERVTHHDTVESFIQKGRDIERRVLSRAVAWFVQGRVIANGAKTVVFRD